MSFAPGILKGKTAVVSGGATGIGSHIVRMLGSLGANVGIVSRKEEKLRAAVSAFKTEDNIDVRWRVGDVRDPDAMKAVMTEFADELGGLDILICNAAGNFICPTEDLYWNGWRTVLDIDLNGTFNCCQAAFPYLKQAVDGGRIVSISATAANFGWPGAAHAGGYGLEQGVGQPRLDRLGFGPFKAGKQVADAAGDVEADAAGRDDAAGLGVERGDAADRKTVAPMGVGHGEGGFLDAGQGGHVGNLFMDFGVHVAQERLGGEQHARDAHLALGLDPPFIAAQAS